MYYPNRREALLATVAIVIKDLEGADGVLNGLDVDVRSDTALDEDTEELTPAQGAALLIVNLIGGLIAQAEEDKTEALAEAKELLADIETTEIPEGDSDAPSSS